MKMRTFILLISIFMVAVSCNQATKNNIQSEEQALEQKEPGLEQRSDFLLSGEYKAVCYSGFRSGQHPDRGNGAVNPTDAEVLEDLHIIKDEMGINLIRVYDSGENSETVLRLIRENNLDMKVMLGIWLKAELSAHETCAWLTEPIPQSVLERNKVENQQEIERGISLANEYADVVVAVNVGNEALVDWNDHKVDPDTIISYCRRVKSAIIQPVTVADNYEWWAAHGEKLSRELDFISVHIYPVWEGHDIDTGLSYSIENLMKVRKALPNAPMVITEAGWASVASEFGTRASEEKQKQYFNEIMQLAREKNITTFFFEAFDEDWKGNPDNPMGAEKHWGLYTVDRKPKLVMQ